jgi:hypothetical protein
MATLLGTATLQGQFTTDFNDVSVATDDFNRVTQTGYRTTFGGEAPFYDGGAYNKPQRAEVLYNDELAKYTEDDFIDSDYIDLLDPNTDFVRAVATASSPNSPGTAGLFLYFDFLDIDPTANVTSIDVQVTLESAIGGYTSYPPYGTQDELHYGKVQATWLNNGFGTNGSDSSQVKINTDSRTTIDLTITPNSLYWGANTGAGDQHCMKVTFTGVVNPPPPTYPGAPSLDVKIYNARAKANYTGRTRRTTDFVRPPSFTSTTVGGFANPQTISSTNYNFNLPSDAIIDGSIIIYAGVGTEPDGTGQTWSPYGADGYGAHRFTISGSIVTTGDYNRSYGGYFLWGQESTHPSGEGQWSADYGAYDYDNDVGLTYAEVTDSNFTLESKYTNTFNSELLKTPYKGTIKLAFVQPISSGDININTVSTVSATPVITHGFTADEIDDFTSTVTLTALGGFVLTGAPQTQASAFTTTVGTTGRIRPGESTINTAFTVTVSAINDLSGAAVTFPSATVSVSAAVARTTPANINTTVTVSTGLAGMTRTNHTVTAPAVATFSAVSGISLLKAVDPDRIFVSPTQTRTHIIPIEGENRAHERRIYIPQQTRTYVIPIEGEDRAHERRLYVPQQTRSVKVEGM